MSHVSKGDAMSVDLIDLWPIVVLLVCVPGFAVALMSL